MRKTHVSFSVFSAVLQGMRESHASLREADWIEQELVKRLSYASRLPVSIPLKQRLLHAARKRYERREKGGASKFFSI